MEQIQPNNLIKVYLKSYSKHFETPLMIIYSGEFISDDGTFISLKDSHGQIFILNKSEIIKIEVR